ncbi:uncharacterized protein LOC142587246 isoform X2 [Dermacentor variabilis]|uniref:uncharacterized protein LOC142587246 isoform X2 n=1 Tax=Dermacentor variabilis TaxID=34621 RepID=UPI003F5B7F77
MPTRTEFSFRRFRLSPKQRLTGDGGAPFNRQCPTLRCRPDKRTGVSKRVMEGGRSSWKRRREKIGQPDHGSCTRAIVFQTRADRGSSDRGNLSTSSCALHDFARPPNSTPRPVDACTRWQNENGRATGLSSRRASRSPRRFFLKVKLTR